MSLQEVPEKKFLRADNDNEKVLSVEEQMAAHGVFTEVPSALTNEKLNTITAGMAKLREQEASKNNTNESLAITKKLEIQQANENKQIDEVEGVLRTYAKKQEGETASAPQAPEIKPEIKKAAPEVKIAPDQIIEAKKGGSAQSFKETLKHSLVGDIGAGLERIKIGIASEPFIAVYETFYKWRHGRTVQKEVKMLGYKKEAESREEKLGQINKAIEQSKKDGKYTAEAAKLYERERDTYTKEIERFKKKQDNTHRQWEDSSNKDAYWRNKQKLVTEGSIGKLEEKARPYAHKFEELKEKHTAIGAKIEEYKTTKEKEVAALSAFEKKIRDPNIEPAKRAVLELQAEQAREALAENENAYNAELAKRHRIEGKMNETNLRLGRWRGMSNEMARMGNRPHSSAEHEAVKEEVTEHHKPTFSHAPEPAAPDVVVAPAVSEAEVAPESPASPAAAPTQERAEVLQVKPADYIKKWNELFKDTKVDTKAFTDSCRLKPNEVVSSKQIEDNIIKMLLPAVPISPHREIFEEGMRARFAKTREALTKQS